MHELSGFVPLRLVSSGAGTTCLQGTLCPWSLSQGSLGLHRVWPEQALAGNPPWSGLRIWKSSGQLTSTISPTWAGFQHVMLSHIPGQPVRERAR